MPVYLAWVGVRVFGCSDELVMDQMVGWWMLELVPATRPILGARVGVGISDEFLNLMVILCIDSCSTIDISRT